MKRINILPPTYLFITIIIVIALHFILPITIFIPFPWNLIGILPIILGIVFNLIADNAFKVRMTTVKPFEESSALVTNGVFRLSRNPMYLGFVFILLGIGTLLGSLTPFLITLLFTISIYRMYIIVEEKMLEEKFGEEWLSYKNKVRRWI